MEYEKEYSCVERNGNVFSKSIEIEQDFTESIPAYCDDIFRVVKCTSHSFVNSASISQNEVMIYGKTQIMLTYYNENSLLCYTDFEEEFSRNIPVENLSDYAFPRVEICDKYTNFRIINQRRIDVHSSAQLSVNVYDRIKYPCINDCAGSKLNTKNIKTSDIIASNVSKIEFDEEFSLPADCDSINRIISTSCLAHLTETKIIKDKMLVKATVDADIAYTSGDDDERLLKVSESFSLSKIIDQSLIDEGDIIICDVSVGNVFNKAKSSSGDKLCNIELFGEIIINSVFIREEERSFVTDGFIPKKNSNCSYSDCPIMTEGKAVYETALFNQSVETSNEINEVKEIGINLSAPVLRNKKVVSNAETVVLFENRNGDIVSCASTAEISFDVNGYDGAIASLSVKSLDYSISSDNKIEIRINAQMNSYAYNNSNIRILSDIEAGEGEIEYPSLSIYFAKKDEDVWDIAKSFSSDTDMIMNENNLQSKTVDKDRILIIPRV